MPPLLLIAAQAGNATEVSRLLAAGAQVDASHNECTALHMAAANGHSRVVRTLLAAGASPWKAGVGGMLPLHMAAIKCQLAAVRLLLDAAPGTAAARDQYGRCALHYAAEVGPPALVRLLLAVAPQAALVKAHRDEFPLFMAAREGRDHIVPLLLEAAPEAAVEMARVHGGGTTPLLAACLRGHTAVVRQLLAAAPQAATMQDGSLAPVHVTVGLQQPGMLRLLLEAAPQAALMAYPEGSLPIHLAAMAPDPACSAAMVRQLLDAAPAAAAARAENVSGYTALHLAAMRANAAAAAALVAAAPQAAGMRAGDNDRTPLEMALSAAARAALWEAHPEQHEEAENDDLPPPTSALNIKTARPLLAVVPPSVSLPLLVQQGDLTRPLFSEVVEHWPLTAAQWEQVPAPCPCLGTALPAVLQRSPAEAAALVARLPAADSARLRTFALALRRSQRRFDVYLPAELADRILCLFDC